MLRKQTFWGGVHPAGRKELSSGAPLEDCPPPREVVIPLLQHIGKPCTPLVKAGDHVDMGQKIGDGEGLCVPVHASVSGTVKAVEPRSHPSGQPHLAVVIENDFQNTYHSAVPPCADTDALDADALIRRIREAGLVGMGGATFPTDIKANIGKVETLIANACECEPYITADLRLLQERERYGRIAIIASATRYEGLVYKQDLKDWSKIPGVTVQYALAKPTDAVQAHVGYINDLLPELDFDWANARAILCASPRRIKLVARDLLGLGMNGKDIFTSLETHMRCGVGKCGHCKVGAHYMCLDGPVFTYEEMLQLPEEF